MVAVVPKEKKKERKKNSTKVRSVTKPGENHTISQN
jgi:hypothetical protein